MNDRARNRVVLWGPQEDDLGDLQTTLERRGFQVQTLESEKEVHAAVQRNEADLVVARLCSGFEFPLDLLGWMKIRFSPPPVLIVTEGRNVRLYLEAMQRGAFDCVGLPLDEHELLRLVAQALESCLHPVAAPGGGE